MTFRTVNQLKLTNFIPSFRPTVHTANTKHYPRHVRKLYLKKHSCWKLYRQFRTFSGLKNY